MKVIQEEYSKNIDVAQAIELSDRAIEKALGEKPTVERGLVTAKNAVFEKISNG